MQSSDSESRIKPATLSAKLRSVARKIHHHPDRNKEPPQPEYQITHTPDGPRLRADQVEIPSNEELKVLLESWKGIDPQDIMSGRSGTARQARADRRAGRGETRESKASQMSAPVRFKDMPRAEKWEGPRRAPRPESDRVQQRPLPSPRRGSGASSLKPSRPKRPASPLMPLRPKSPPLPPLPSSPPSTARATYWPGPDSPPLDDLKSPDRKPKSIDDLLASLPKGPTRHGGFNDESYADAVDIYRPSHRASNETRSLDARIGDLSTFEGDDLVSENGGTIVFKLEEPPSEFGLKKERCRMPGCNGLTVGGSGICTFCSASFAPRLSVFDPVERSEVGRQAAPPVPELPRHIVQAMKRPSAQIARKMTMVSPAKPRKISVGSKGMAASVESASEDGETNKLVSMLLSPRYASSTSTGGSSSTVAYVKQISRFQSETPDLVLRKREASFSKTSGPAKEKTGRARLEENSAARSSVASTASLSSNRTSSPSPYGGHWPEMEYYFDDANFRQPSPGFKFDEAATPRSARDGHSAGRLLRARGEKSVRQQREGEVPKSLLLMQLRNRQKDGDEDEYTDEEVMSPLLSGAPERARF